MDFDTIFAEVPLEKFSLLSEEDKLTLFKLEQQFRIQFQKENKSLKQKLNFAEQQSLLVNEKYISIKNKFFGKSSERSAPLTGSNKEPKIKPDLPSKKRILLPSQRYPNAPLLEKDITLDVLPDCSCCGSLMQDSGMTEDSEYLTVIPKQYMIIRQKRHKYRCGHCHGDIQTAPGIPRIKDGSVYSDEMIVDVALTKYCDLIPIERYSAIAARGGLPDLPPQSLIESSHYLADFVVQAYNKLREEILEAKVLHADETPHRMLEGSSKTNWRLWGFSTPQSSYFEMHSTRSGDVAYDLFKKAKCEYLISDVFSGYNKAVRITNEQRLKEKETLLQKAYCNAHARRKFKEAEKDFKDEAQFFIARYQAIYLLEQESRGQAHNKILEYRSQMTHYFIEMRDKALSYSNQYSSKSSLMKAVGYFLRSFAGFTLFLSIPEIPIDNNPQERLLRNPVIGRKTWYGTHSKQGAKTACILFSLVESCKLNKINPREYFKALVADLHSGKGAYTPAVYLLNFQKSD